MRKSQHSSCAIKGIIPSIISASRGLVAFFLPFIGYGSPIFWAAYMWCGVSDMIDGPLARKMNVASRTGAMIDSIADFIFVMTAAIAILPKLFIPTWVWISMGMIVIVKLSSIVSGLILSRKVVVLHTIANKVTGLLVFLFPISINWISFNYAAAVVIAVAMFAAIQEGHFIRTENHGTV